MPEFFTDTPLLTARFDAALRVSLADKLHNARSILTDYRAHGDALWARFGQGKELATRVYYRELVAAEERQGPDTRVSFDWG